MKQINDTLRLMYESPKADSLSISSEGILCNSKVNAMTETGATWTDEVDASLKW